MRNKTRLETADWSTINIRELLKRPRYNLPPTYHLQKDSGNGCSGDPPGYPTYFTRSVYTQYGNTSKGPGLVIDTMNHGLRIVPQNLGILWLKLPMEHPRTQAWIQATMLHHRHCYHLPGWKNWRDESHFLIWPGGFMGNTPFGKLNDIEFETDYARKNKAFDKWERKHQNDFRKSMEHANEIITRQCIAVATSDNHNGTILVRRHYLEFKPTEELIQAEFPHPGNWWKTMAEKPQPDQCPGQYRHPHPVNGTWCQMCGWNSKNE